MTAPTANPWIAYRQPRLQPRLRLFCFPYAGGAASTYRSWAGELPEEIEVCPVQLPGREGRIRQPALLGMDELVDAAAAGLGDELDRGPHAFFGHSMGAVVAYELARRRRDAGRPEPLHLIVSARNAPTVPDPDEPIHDLPTERFQATPARAQRHPSRGSRPPRADGAGGAAAARRLPRQRDLRAPPRRASRGPADGDRRAGRRARVAGQPGGVARAHPRAVPAAHAARRPFLPQRPGPPRPARPSSPVACWAEAPSAVLPGRLRRP